MGGPTGESYPPIFSHVTNISKEPPRYSLFELLKLTAITAVVLAALRILGPQKSWLVFVVCYAFAPTIAMLLVQRLSKYSLSVRCAAAVLTLISLATGMTVLCGLFYSAEAMLFVIFGTLIEWPGQLAILVCLRLIIGNRPAATTP